MKQNLETTTEEFKTFDLSIFHRTVQRIDEKLEKYQLDTTVLLDRLKTAERTITEQRHLVNSLETEVSILQRKNAELASVAKKLIENYTDDEL